MIKESDNEVDTWEHILKTKDYLITNLREELYNQ